MLVIVQAPTLPQCHVDPKGAKYPNMKGPRFVSETVIINAPRVQALLSGPTGGPVGQPRRVPPSAAASGPQETGRGSYCAEGLQSRNVPLKALWSRYLVGVVLGYVWPRFSGSWGPQGCEPGFPFAFGERNYVFLGERVSWSPLK